MKSIFRFVRFFFQKFFSKANKLYRWTILSGGPFRKLIRKSWHPKKINLGDRNRNFVCWGWETMDITNADYILNFHETRLPLEDDSCSAIYSSAMIEHISDESANNLFSEIHRLLIKGGSFRVVCPDLDLALQAYRDNNQYHFLSNSMWLFNSVRQGVLPKESIELHNNVVRVLASYIETGAGPIVDKEIFEKNFSELDKYEFAKWCVSLLNKDKIQKDTNLGHINAYDYSKLEKMLYSAGFSKVKLKAATQYDNPAYAKSEFDKIERRLEWICLFVEAQK
jgi:SAM-dependent methyltransferase